jgi:hypothetical protein
MRIERYHELYPSLECVWANSTGESDELLRGYVRVAGTTFIGFWLDSLKISDRRNDGP